MLFEIYDTMGCRGSELVWRILDHARAQLTCVKFDEADFNRHPAQRRYR